MSTAIPVRTILAVVHVTCDPVLDRILVRFEPGTVYQGLPHAVEDFRFEFRGHGERFWQRSARAWSLPNTPSIVLRLDRWCGRMDHLVDIDWHLPF